MEHLKAVMTAQNSAHPKALRKALRMDFYLVCPREPHWESMMAEMTAGLIQTELSSVQTSEW